MSERHLRRRLLRRLCCDPATVDFVLVKSAGNLLTEHFRKVRIQSACCSEAVKRRDRELHHIDVCGERRFASGSIASLPVAKQNANRKLVLEGSAAMLAPDGTTSSTIDRYGWTVSDESVDLTVASATGFSQENLVILPDSTRNFTFTLTAPFDICSQAERSAFSRVVVVMNRAP